MFRAGRAATAGGWICGLCGGADLGARASSLFEQFIRKPFLRECTKQEVLMQKELELVKVKKELEALRIVATLLRDEEDWVREAAQPTLTVTGPPLVKAGAVIDSPPASSLQRGRWRNAAKRFFPVRKYS